MGDARELDRIGAIRRRLRELESIKAELRHRRDRFMRRADATLRDPPLVLRLATRRGMVWRKRVKVTGGPQSTVEFHTEEGRAALSGFSPQLQAKYLELEQERILLNMQAKIVSSEIRHIKHYLDKHEHARELQRELKSG